MACGKVEEIHIMPGQDTRTEARDWIGMKATSRPSLFTSGESLSEAVMVAGFDCCVKVLITGYAPSVIKTAPKSEGLQKGGSYHHSAPTGA